jgi:hypothetical protein
MARIFGLVFSGFMVRLYGAGMALYVGIQAYGFITHAFGAVNTSLSVLG